MMGSQALNKHIYRVFLCIYLYILSPLVANELRNVEITDIQITPDLTFCQNASLSCKAIPADSFIWWSFSGENITEDERHMLDVLPGETKLHISCITLDDIGNFTCHAMSSDESVEEEVTRTVFLDMTVPATVYPGNDVRVRLDKPEVLSCLFSGYPISDFKWFRNGTGLQEIIPETTGNLTAVKSVVKFSSVTRKDNGTYTCSCVGPKGVVSADVSLFVLAEPRVTIDFVKAVGAHRIFLNWTVNNGNEPVEEYFIQYRKNGTANFIYYHEKIGGGNISYIMKNLEPNTAYQPAITAKNSIGKSGMYNFPSFVTTLEKDPVFIPEVSVTGVTVDSITIGWTPPPIDIRNHVQYYHLVLQNNATKKEAIQHADTMNFYLFTQLQPATTYHFKMSACSEYTNQCGNTSKEVNGTTLDGVSGPPANVSVLCQYDTNSIMRSVLVSWARPLQPNGKISRYNVVIMGAAMYKNELGEVKKEEGPLSSLSVNENVHNAKFSNMAPNTNYTVLISGVTRSRRGGEEASGYCNMPPAIPDKDKMTHFSWIKVEEQGRWLFKLFLPRISERNGPICCYRIYLVKLEPHQSIADLPSPPENLPIVTYDEAHHSRKGGAYLAEMFTSDNLVTEVFLGDGQTALSNNSACLRCMRVRKVVTTTSTTTTVTPAAPSETSTMNNIVTTTTTSNSSSITTTVMTNSTFLVASAPTLAAVQSSNTLSVDSPVSTVPAQELIKQKQKRSHILVPQTTISPDRSLIIDGQLDTRSNYTGFIEIMVLGENGVLLPAFTSYFNTLMPGPQVIHVESAHALAIALQVLCVLTLVVLVALLGLCLLQRYTKQMADAQGVEMTLTNSLRHLCRSLRGRHVLVSSSPPDMAPIAKSDLTNAYVERHRDTDYGFQHEFELLPDRFSDRTTRHSEARENMYKNRYPDIKAYDQTRVRLSQIDSVIGSDYINANFVIGYKERKKFICAQGPMDNTVCDFWRMIWEQHLEMILMLTNLEEYSKTKCAKYWPDEAEGEKYFGDITVAHVREKRYSDFIIRELKMTRSSGGSKDNEDRSIIQYHFLVWKDFMAPEHPSGILKFIKRVNEAYSLEKGPILVHCSAGVGRTGTLVALDSLLQQLQDEGQAAIFNTVCDLRHQRNFLVQSLKQYIFIYRALMEVAQFGETEIKGSSLKSSVEKLRLRENGKDKCRMEEEFDKINKVLEDRKSFSVGGGEENRLKNRNELVIPYDRNRVILTPISGREHSTYINASFIEGYDNSESFIITQDPLETTIPDFWRMISEQCISTLVMLSDLGEGPKKCLRYWPDDEICHDHIKVKYIQSESCPYYTRRELCVTNIKTDESIVVTQFQYNGWPTVEGEVPEVTRGLIELVDQTQSHQEAHGGSAPIAVHCNHGSDRSSMFVALSILVQQLRTEKRIDIFTTTRKLRSQRQGMLQTFAQYEFLHRAIVNYADLHHLVEDET